MYPVLSLSLFQRHYFYRLGLILSLISLLSSCGSPETAGPPLPFTLVTSLVVGTSAGSVAWSADSTLLAVIAPRTVQVWNVATQRIQTTYRGYPADVTSFAFSPDGTRVASVDWDGWIALWDPRSGAEYWRVQTGDPIVPRASTGGERLRYGLAFSADQTVVLTYTGTHVWVWEATTGHLLMRSPVDGGIMSSPNDTVTLVYSGAVEDSGSKRLTLWDMRTDHDIQQISVGDISNWALSGTGQFVAFEQRDTDMLNVWNVTTAQTQWRVDRSKWRRLAFSANDTYLAASADDHDSVAIWTVRDGTRVTTLELGSGEGLPLYGLKFSPDATFLLTARGSGPEADDWVRSSATPAPRIQEAIHVWRVADGTLVQQLTDHGDAVYVLAFSPDSTMLASGSTDGTIKIWRYQPSK